MAARSWVASANGGATDFPLENLPYGVFSANGGAPRCAVAIGDFVLDVAALEREGVIALAGGRCCRSRAGTRLWAPGWRPGRRSGRG